MDISTLATGTAHEASAGGIPIFSVRAGGDAHGGTCLAARYFDVRVNVDDVTQPAGCMRGKVERYVYKSVRNPRIPSPVRRALPACTGQRHHRDMRVPAGA